jgi:heme-degrading monooxygenase HmoA
VIAVVKDLETTWPQYGRERIWNAVYQPILIYRNSLDDVPTDMNSQKEAPVLNVNAFNFPTIEWEKFNAWFGEYGRPVFLPLFQAVHGLKEYRCYKWTGVTRPAKVKEYPIFLTISFFETLRACENFTMGPEFNVFQAAVKLGLPRGFSSQWNVPYELVKNFRK